MSNDKSDPLIGETLGETYKIESKLGAGGMGTVYLASHTRVQRAFAIKVLNFKLSDDEMANTRFEREAMIGSRLGHEHIAQVVDFNHTEEGFPFIVMELLEGEDLNERLKKRGKLSLVEAASIIRQVCIALDAAHEEDVVHRDLKPENIFLCTKRGGGEAVKVMDFGVSKVLSSDSVVTAHATLLGTPWYMAPEQAEGKVQLMDRRTDMFSLGLIFYHMLSGKMPFEGDSVPAILFQVVHSMPDPIEQVLPDLPAPVAQIVTKAISKPREERFQSAQEFVAALEEAMGELWGEVLIHEVGTAVTGTQKKVRVTGKQIAASKAAAKSSDDVASMDTVCAATAETAAGGALDAAGDDEDLSTAATVMGSPAKRMTTLSSGAGEARAEASPAGRRQGLMVAVGVVVLLGAGGLIYYQTTANSGGPAPVEQPRSIAAAHPPARPPRPAPAPQPRPAPAPKAEQQPKVATRPLSVVSTPAGAVVLIAKKSVGKTPLTDLPVSRDALRVTIRRGGYGSRVVKVPAGEAPHKLRVTLVLRKSSVNVVALHKGKPLEADIYLDGKKMDQTPALLPDLKPGPYRIQVRANGYKSRSQSVTLRPGQTKRLVLSLKKL